MPNDGGSWSPPLSAEGLPYLAKVTGSSLYLVLNRQGIYRYIDGAHVHAELYRAWGSDLDLWTVPKTKNATARPKEIKQLYAQYGVTVDSMVYSWKRGGTKYTETDLGRTEIVESVWRADPPPAVRHPECDEWLNRVFGDYADRVRDWLSVLPQLDKEAAALYVHDEQTGVGKQMLAKACARYFGASPV